MQLDKLKERLCEFGLNPREWELKLKRSIGHLTRIDIRSSSDEDFGFEGWADGSKWLVLILMD